MIARMLLLLMIFLSCAPRGYCKENKPEDFVRDFYVWYIKKLTTEDRSPVFDDTIYQYVYRCTVNKCRIDRERGRLGADYFTDAQDADPAWGQKLAVSQAVPVDASVSIVTVSFDPSEKGAPCLLIFLKKEGNLLHIIKIENVRGYY